TGTGPRPPRRATGAVSPRAAPARASPLDAHSSSRARSGYPSSLGRVSLRLNRRSTLAVLAVGLGAPVAVLAAVSCIPDLASLAATGDAGGPDQVAADVAQPYCGDGIIQLEAGEQCDPGALADGATGAQGCTRDCRMDCDGGFVWNRNNHCYAEQAAADTILGAAQRCGVASPHVVTFASIDELTAVTTAIDAGAFWVGLQPDELQGGYYALAAYEPGWSTSCPGCFANTPVPTHPLPGDGGCVRGFVDLSRSWEAVGCADGGFHRLICE